MPDHSRRLALVAATTSLVLSPVLLSTPVSASGAATGPERRAATTYVEADRWIAGIGTDGVTVAPDGSVVVTHVGHNRLSRYAADGTLLSATELPFSDPFGVDADAAGNLHVTSYSETGQVHVLSPAGAPLRTYSVPAGATSQFTPWGVEVLPDGTSLTANLVGDDVQRTLPDGTWGGRVGSSGLDPGFFDAPIDVASSPDGAVFYVLESATKRVQAFSVADARLVGLWGQPGYDPGQFNEPRSIATTPDGRILVLDGLGAADAVLHEFAADGTFLGRTPLPVSQVHGVAVDADGAAYVTGLIGFPNGGYGVLKLAPKGTEPPVRPSRATIRAAKLDADRARRTAALRVRCSEGDTRCAGRVVVRSTTGNKDTRVATGRYRVAAGRTVAITLRLRTEARAALRGRASIRVVVELRPSAGKGDRRRLRLTR